MSSLKPREEKALCFIRAQVKTHGIPPTCEEIAGHLGSPKSKAAALYILDALEGRGLISRPLGPGRRNRGIQLIETEDYHAPDCNCDGCARARYLADRKLVEALQVRAPSLLRGKLNNAKPLSARTRVYWRDGFPPSLTGDAA